MSRFRKTPKRIVVKVGSSSITHVNGEVNLKKIDTLAWELANLKNHGYEVILVSSGAIFAGVRRMHMKEKPKDVAGKQAASAIGQVALMNTYHRAFSEYNYSAAQLLLTRVVERDPQMQENARASIERLLNLDTIVVINENDAISTYEIQFGDNDTLSAVVARIIGADLLILCSDIDGLYTKNPKIYEDATRISKVEELTDDIYAMAGDAISSSGTGGMITKLKAADLCLQRGISMVIASSEDFHVIGKIVDGEDVGTLFEGRRHHESH